MKKRRSDSDIMIDVLEEGARRSFSNEQIDFKLYGPDEMPIIIDLIESGKVRGDTGHIDGGLGVALDGITLEGRQFRDELIAARDEKKLSSRLKKAIWAGMGAALGAVGTLILEYLKKKVGPN